MHLEQSLPLFAGKIDRGFAMLEAGRVHDDVDRTVKAVLAVIQQSSSIDGHHVGGHRHRVRHLLGRGLELLRGAGNERYLRAGLAQSLGNGLPDPAPTTGDDRTTTVQLEQIQYRLGH